jgi:Peptidase A4 family
MKPFSENSFALAHGVKRYCAGVVAVLLGIAMAGVLMPRPLRADEPAASAHDAATVARARAAFLKAMSSRRPMVRSGVAALASNGGATSAPTANWSGYADAEAGSKTVSSVSGQWVIPNVQCPVAPYQNQDAFFAQWVGLDGVTNATVEQLGTATQCFEGVEYYYVWYEMFPAGTVEEGTLACINYNFDCPEPGDRISASVTVTPAGNYTLSLIDFTHPAEGFSVAASCSPSTCLNSSGEWIVERPAFEVPPDLIEFTPLADFFQTSFSNAELTSGGRTTQIEGFQDGPVYDVQMADDSASYWLDCVGQFFGAPRLLLTTNPNSCPVVPAINGSFTISWDSSF